MLENVTNLPNKAVKWVSFKKKVAVKAIKSRINRFTTKVTRTYRTITGWILAHISEILSFFHITLGVFFVIWGLETLLPWSVWRVLVGVYLLLWVGIAYMKNLFKSGLYI